MLPRPLNSLLLSELLHTHSTNRRPHGFRYSLLHVTYFAHAKGDLSLAYVVTSQYHDEG